ncbi:hypothetical protein RI054_17g77900 [Pseudoscourfieldia marina]
MSNAAPPPPWGCMGMLGCVGSTEGIDELVQDIRSHERSLGGRDECIAYAQGKLKANEVGVILLAIDSGKKPEALRRLHVAARGECTKRLNAASKALGGEVHRRRNMLKDLEKRLYELGELPDNEWPAGMKKYFSAQAGSAQKTPNTRITRTVTYNADDGLLKISDIDKLTAVVVKKEKKLNGDCAESEVFCKKELERLIKSANDEGVKEVLEREADAINTALTPPKGSTLVDRHKKCLEWKARVQNLCTRDGQIRVLVRLRREHLARARRVARPFEAGDESGERRALLGDDTYTRKKDGEESIAMLEEREKQRVYPRLYRTLKALVLALEQYKREEGKDFAVDIDDIGPTYISRDHESYIETVKRELRIVEQYGVGVRDEDRVFADKANFGAHAVPDVSSHSPPSPNSARKGFGSSTKRASYIATPPKTEWGLYTSSTNDPLTYATLPNASPDAMQAVNKKLNFSRCTVELFGPSSGTHKDTASARGKKDYAKMRVDNRKAAKAAAAISAHSVASPSSSMVSTPNARLPQDSPAGPDRKKSLFQRFATAVRADVRMQQIASRQDKYLASSDNAEIASQSSTSSSPPKAKDNPTSIMILSNGLVVHSRPGQFARTQTWLKPKANETGSRSPAYARQKKDRDWVASTSPTQRELSYEVPAPSPIAGRRTTTALKG